MLFISCILPKILLARLYLEESRGSIPSWNTTDSNILLFNHSRYVSLYCTYASSPLPLISSEIALSLLSAYFIQSAAASLSGFVNIRIFPFKAPDTVSFILASTCSLLTLDNSRVSSLMINGLAILEVKVCLPSLGGKPQNRRNGELPFIIISGIGVLIKSKTKSELLPTRRNPKSRKNCSSLLQH